MPTPTRQEEEILKNADIAGIGSHCDIDTCKQLDFLPFVCESCKGTFCLDHRTETAHSCKKAGTWLSSLRPKFTSTTPNPYPNPRNLLAAPCAFSKCKTTINTPTQPGVNCTVCRKQYCLTHRLQDAHECKAPGPAATTVAQEKAKEALAKFTKAWGQQKESGAAMFAGLTQGRKPGNTGAVAVMKMKREAKGDEKVPPEKRVYLYVEAEARTTSAKIPKGTFWYSKVCDSP
jgi:predicted nucleic acid binding AN1-type Zn finger protein